MSCREFTVDRIEGACALLVDTEGRLGEVPISWLPEGVGEGDVLEWSISRRPDAQSVRVQRVQGLLETLSQADDGQDMEL